MLKQQSQSQQKSKKNECKRCKGLVVLDYFHSLFRWLRGVRCVNCGWVKLLED